uniref:HSF-type DNA-binding domain-containing protein n=1 Tax=Kalanchoe fedtschenkoi TaxID=63787 RepID=A0A7N0U712_KALFE
MAHQPPPLPLGEQIVAVDLPPPPPTVPDAQRFIPTPFLTKTYQLVDDISIDSIISWNEDGTAFVVWNPAEFARDVLPKYFKHNNFSSFVRQLNTYGFRKVMPDRWEFSNDCFRRGDKRLLCDIVRRKLMSGVSGSSSALTVSAQPVLMDPSTSQSGEGQVFSSNSTPTSAAPMATVFLDHQNNSGNNIGSSSSNNCGTAARAHLIDENDRLKKENTQLWKELSQMKSMCTNIYSMMSNYNPGSGPVPGLGHGLGPPTHAAAGCGSSNNSSQAESVMNPAMNPVAIDLMSSRRLLAAVAEIQAATPAAQPAAEENLCMHSRLFGFQLGSKRARGDGSSDPMDHEDLLQLQQPGPSFNH